MVRLIHVGLGPLGQRIVRDLVAREAASLVGAVDCAPELAGKTLGEVVPDLSACGDVRVHASIPELDGLDGLDGLEYDAAIVTTLSDLELCAPVFRELLERGKAVVSTCEELLWPWLRHPVLAAEFDELAVRHRGRLLGTGINPGFLMDTLPSVLSGACLQVRALEAWRIQDASTRRIPFQKKIGATLDADTFAQRAESGVLRHVGLGESLHFVAHALKFEVERWDEQLEPVIAERDLECGLGPIRAGTAAGVRQVASAWNGDREIVRLEFQAAIGQEDPHDRVRIDGDPPLDVVVRGGVHGDVATSAVVINSLRPLLASRPGLHTMATIPLASSRNP